MTAPGVLSTETLTVLADPASSGSLVVPWWLRIGVLVYVALLVAAFMIYAQTTHRRPWNVLWVLIIFFVPFLGVISYFIAQSIAYRRSGQRPSQGQAERLPPEDFSS